MSNTVIGFSSAVEGPIKYTFDPQRGGSTIRTFTGTETQILALASSYQLLGWRTAITEGPVWKLEATSGEDESGGPGGDEPVDTWELYANISEKEILSSNIPGVLNMTSVDKAFMRDVLDGKIDAREWDYSTAAKTPAWTGDATQQARADQIYRGLVSGMKSLRVNVPTLRHTKSAAWDYEFSSALTGVDEIFGKAALGNRETIPLRIYNNLPSDPSSNPFTRTDGVVVFKGWHKHYPQIQISANAKSQIIVEWEYGEWSTVLHPTYAST